jgi:hypothetical protein
MRYLLSVRPHEAPAIASHLDEVENMAVGLLGAPIFFSCLALVTGGSRAKAGDAIPRVVALYRAFVEEHLSRRHAAGLGTEGSPLASFLSNLEG